MVGNYRARILNAGIQSAIRKRLYFAGLTEARVKTLAAAWAAQIVAAIEKEEEAK